MFKLTNTVFVLAFALGALLYSCGSSTTAYDDKLSEKYQNVKSEAELSFKVFHFSADSSRLYVRLNTGDLLYARRGGNEATAGLIVEIEPIDISESPKKNIATKTFKILDTDKNQEAKTLVASSDFALPFGKMYRLKITARDMNKDATQNKWIDVDKTEFSSRQNFILYESGSAYPLFTDRIKPNKTYRLESNMSVNKPIFGNYYDRVFPLPMPPFSEYEPKPFDYTPDSTFTLEPGDDHAVDFTSTISGFYHFQFDNTQKKGFSAFISADEFPEVETVANMIAPFRYLVGGREFEAIVNARNQKAAIDSVWIDWTGSRDRARKAIKEYYSRVEYANREFSSYVEGWKSDRGLIYIVYGKPNKAYRQGQVETWIYGEENNPLSITFHFITVINPFTDNDYRLSREGLFKQSWYRAVNAWRDGRIY